MTTLADQHAHLIPLLSSLAAGELQEWVIKALTYPESPLFLNRDETPYSVLSHLRDHYLVHQNKLGLKLHASFGDLVRRYLKGGCALDDSLVEDLLLLLHQGPKDFGLMADLIETIDAEPRHSPRLRLRMMQLLAQADSQRDVQFWIRHLHSEDGALTSAAFQGLLWADLDQAIPLLASLRPAVAAGALSISIALEMCIDDPKHYYLLPKILRQLPDCDPMLQAPLAEWLAEIYPQWLEHESRKLKAHWDVHQRDLIVSYPAGHHTNTDGAFLSSKILPREALQELQRRGYDLRTLRFEISTNCGELRFVAERPEGMTHEQAVELLKKRDRA